MFGKPLCLATLLFVVTFIFTLTYAHQGQACVSDVPHSTVQFTIKRQPIFDALIAFGLQAGISVLIESADADGENEPLSARLKPADALTLLLKGTGLAFRETSAGFAIYSDHEFEKSEPTPTTYSALENTSRVVSKTQAADTQEIAEILVTAQKRVERLQNVSIAISSFSVRNIQDLSFNELGDIATQTPGLDMKNALGSVNPIYTLRGIGLNDYNVNNNPSVGIYLDEVYLASAAYQSFPLFDVGPIEVLRGPQNTLHGRNTTGGTINIRSAQPTEQFHAYVKVDVGNWGSRKSQAAISGPIGDSTFGRLAVHRETSHGYYTNNGNSSVAGRIGQDASTLDSRGYLYGQPSAATALPPNKLVPPDDDFFSKDVSAVRGTLQWNVNPNASITTSIHYLNDNSDMLVRSMGVDSVDRNGFSPSDNDPFTVDANFGAGGSKADIKGIGGYLRFAANIGAGQLVMLTGYESIKRILPFEDSSPWRIIDQLFDEDMREISQEIRFTLAPNERWLWIIGGYYGRENFSLRKDVNALDAILRTNVRTDFDQNSRNWATFAQLEWSMSETLRIKAGLRHSHDFKSYAGGTFLPVTPYGQYGVDLAPTFWDLPLVSQDKFNESDWSGMFSIDWSLGQGDLAYISWRKGHKSGGFDGSTITNIASLSPFYGERLYAWESGLKSRWRENKIQWNSAIFLYDYQDMQAESDQALGTEDAIFESIRANVGQARVWGLESKLWLKPAVGLDIQLGVAYLNTKITDWYVQGRNSQDPAIAAEASAIRDAYIGNHLPDSPKLTFNQIIKYKFSVSDQISLESVLNSNYVSRVYKNIDNDQHLRAESYWLLNGRVTLSGADARWQLSIWGNNLTNKVYFRERVENFGAAWIYETPGAPRSYGLALGYRWD